MALVDLNIFWDDVPYAYKQKFPAEGVFDGGLRNIVLCLGASGDISSDMVLPFDPEGLRAGEYVPDVVFFGIHIEGKTAGQSIYIILAHTELPGSFVSGTVFSGPTTNTKMILYNIENSEMVPLIGEEAFLGGGASNVYMVGPSGFKADGDFDPTIFSNTPPAVPVPEWHDYTGPDFWTISETDPVTTYWDGSAWVYMPESYSDAIYLSTVYEKDDPNWAEGFNPTKAKITYSGIETCFDPGNTYSISVTFNNETSWVQIVSGQIYDVECPDTYHTGMRTIKFKYGWQHPTDIMRIEKIELFGVVPTGI